MKPDAWSCRFPQTGASAKEWSARLACAEALNIDYETDVVLGFPGTTPLPEAVDAYRRFLGRQSNNIGFHTHGASLPIEFGFQGTQDLENEVVKALGSLVGAHHPDDIDGYICSGGTEGNDHGIWMGRQKLQTDPDGKGRGKGFRQGIVLLASFLTHYSVQKAFNRLLAGRNGSQYVTLPTNHNGEVTPEIIEEYITEQLAAGFGRFLLVLNAGTTNLGSVDQIDRINAKLVEIKKLGSFASYIHVDAAFGGFVLPFMEPDYPFAFQNEFVGSISLDAHKMGYVPFGACIFLTRKNYLERYTRTNAIYLGAQHADYTVCGSRSGATAAACWAAINTLGHEGYRARMERCTTTLGYLKQRLREFNADGNEEIFLYPARLNVQTVRFSTRLAQALEMAEARRKQSGSKPFCIPRDEFPLDLTARPERASLTRSSTVVVHRFVATPTVTTAKIDIFISALREALFSVT